MKQEILDRLNDLPHLYKEILGGEIAPSYSSQIEQWTNGTFNVVVIGEIKKGKSSFVNALLDTENLVPIDSDVATSTIFRVSYAEEVSYKVHFTKASHKQALSISATELADYGTEKGNPGNEKQVEYIEVNHPSPLLKAGITITDTPGLGALFAGHKMATYQQIPMADAVFFICDSTSAPIGRLDLEYMRDILKMTPNMYMVQTKVHAADEAKVNSRMAENKAIICENFKVKESDIPYFMTDAGTYFDGKRLENEELIEGSGYPRLHQFLMQDLLSAKDALLELRIQTYISSYVLELKEALSNKKSILAADTEKKRKELSEGLLQSQRELEDWNLVGFPKLKRQVDASFRTISRESKKQCDELRPTGLLQATYETQIKEATTIEMLAEIEREMGEKLVSEAQTYYQGILKDVTEQIINTLAGISDSLIVGLALPEEEELNIEDNINYLIGRGKTMRHSSSTFERTRNVSAGCTMGATVGFVLGSLAGSVVPVAGTAAGGALGAKIGLALGPILGGRLAYQHTKKNDFEHYRNNLLNTLSQCFANLSNAVSEATQFYVTSAQIAVQDALTQWYLDRKRSIENQLEQIKSRARTHETDVKKEAEALAGLEKRLHVLCLCWIPKATPSA